MPRRRGLIKREVLTSTERLVEELAAHIIEPAGDGVIVRREKTQLVRWEWWADGGPHGMSVGGWSATKRGARRSALKQLEAWEAIIPPATATEGNPSATAGD